MAKKVYLVDTENVGAVWKHLFELAANTDDILLFYTENTPFLSYNDLDFVLSYKDRFTMIKCYTGNNALDFQLVSYLGLEYSLISRHFLPLFRLLQNRLISLALLFFHSYFFSIHSYHFIFQNSLFLRIHQELN